MKLRMRGGRKRRDSVDGGRAAKRSKRRKNGAEEPWYHNVAPIFESPVSDEFQDLTLPPEDPAASYEEPSVQVTVERTLPPVEPSYEMPSEVDDGIHEAAAPPSIEPLGDLPPVATGDPFEVAREAVADALAEATASDEPAAPHDALEPAAASVEPLPASPGAALPEPEPESAFTPEPESALAPEPETAHEAEAPLETAPAPQRPFVHDSGAQPAVDPPMIIPIRAYYMTRADDTLRSVAAQFLNTPTRWQELRSLNAAYPGIADAGPDTVLPVGSSLALPGDPLPWGRPDPVYLWTLAEKFLYTAWGREPSPEEVVPFWRGLTSGAQHLDMGPGAPQALGEAADLPTEPPIPPAMQPPGAPPEPEAAEPVQPEPPVEELHAEAETPTEPGSPVDGFALEESAVEEAAPGEPAVDEPVVAELVLEGPAVELPVVEEPAVEEPAVEEWMVEEPVVHEPVFEEFVAQEPVVQEPVFAEPVVEEFVAEERLAEGLVVEEPVVQEPVVEEPVYEAAPPPPASPPPAPPQYGEPAVPAAAEPVAEPPAPPPPPLPPPPPAAPTHEPQAPHRYEPPTAPAPAFEPMPGMPDLGPIEPPAPAPEESEGAPLPAFMPSLTGATPSAELPVEDVVASSQRALAGTAIGDAMMLWQLGRLRRRGSKRAGREPDPLELSLEQTARMDSLRLIEAAMRHLRAVTVAQLKPKPRVVCVRVGTYGFEVLLDQPVEAPEGWQAVTGGYVLELPRGVTAEQLDAGGRGPSLCPALVPVGDTAEGPLLLNIEEIGCLAVSGPNNPTASLLTSIVETLGSSPLAGDIRIVTVGVSSPLGPGWERIHTTSFDSPQLEHLLSTAHSPAHSGTGAIDVLVVGPGNDLLFQRAGQIASTPGSRLVLVGATSSAAARWPWRIHVDENHRAVVHPIAVNIVAMQATRPELTYLLSSAADDPRTT